MPENFQTVGFGAQDTSANVRFRPKADIQRAKPDGHANPAGRFIASKTHAGI
jgi:hypothetical protein